MDPLVSAAASRQLEESKKSQMVREAHANSILGKLRSRKILSKKKNPTAKLRPPTRNRSRDIDSPSHGPPKSLQN